MTGRYRAINIVFLPNSRSALPQETDEPSTSRSRTVTDVMTKSNYTTRILRNEYTDEQVIYESENGIRLKKEFVKLVRKFPIVWNQKKPKPKTTKIEQKKSENEDVWINIALMLYRRTGKLFEIDALIRLWDFLKTSYSAHLKKQVSRWPYMAVMKFYKPIIMRALKRRQKETRFFSTHRIDKRKHRPSKPNITSSPWSEKTDYASSSNEGEWRMDLESGRIVLLNEVMEEHSRLEYEESVMEDFDFEETTFDDSMHRVNSVEVPEDWELRENEILLMEDESDEDEEDRRDSDLARMRRRVPEVPKVPEAQATTTGADLEGEIGELHPMTDDEESCAFDESEGILDENLAFYGNDLAELEPEIQRCVFDGPPFNFGESPVHGTEGSIAGNKDSEGSHRKTGNDEGNEDIGPAHEVIGNEWGAVEGSAKNIRQSEGGTFESTSQKVVESGGSVQASKVCEDDDVRGPAESILRSEGGKHVGSAEEDSDYGSDGMEDSAEEVLECERGSDSGPSQEVVEREGDDDEGPSEEVGRVDNAAGESGGPAQAQFRTPKEEVEEESDSGYVRADLPKAVQALLGLDFFGKSCPMVSRESFEPLEGEERVEDANNADPAVSEPSAQQEPAQPTQIRTDAPPPQSEMRSNPPRKRNGSTNDSPTKRCAVSNMRQQPAAAPTSISSSSNAHTARATPGIYSGPQGHLSPEWMLGQGPSQNPPFLDGVQMQMPNPYPTMPVADSIAPTPSSSSNPQILGGMQMQMPYPYLRPPPAADSIGNHLNLPNPGSMSVPNPYAGIPVQRTKAPPAGTESRPIPIAPRPQVRFGEVLQISTSSGLPPAPQGRQTRQFYMPVDPARLNQFRTVENRTAQAPPLSQGLSNAPIANRPALRVQQRVAGLLFQTGSASDAPSTSGSRPAPVLQGPSTSQSSRPAAPEMPRIRMNQSRQNQNPPALLANIRAEPQHYPLPPGMPVADDPLTAPFLNKFFESYNNTFNSIREDAAFMVPAVNNQFRQLLRDHCDKSGLDTEEIFRQND